jgi:cyclophilin family peptidyl-prolyl cis-trans isomerase
MRTGLRLLAGTIFAAGIVGCGSQTPAPVKVGDGSGSAPPVLSISNSVPTASAPAPAGGDKLHQSFQQAVFEDSPGNQQVPPDRTMAGLSTGKLRVEVQRLWDTVRFRAPNGSPIGYRAKFDTELGSFTVELRPEVAPNHVRNFICLARAGYYNGLVFEHVIRQQADDDPNIKLEMVEGGCPVGTGEPGVGHLGYWLKPEFDPAVKHEPGSFGAFHDDSPESAACRFYVTLTPAPAMDGNFTAFGRVVTGLDVLRTIAARPNVEGTLQPQKPVVIRNVAIETVEGR